MRRAVPFVLVLLSSCAVADDAAPTPPAATLPAPADSEAPDPAVSSPEARSTAAPLMSGPGALDLSVVWHGGDEPLPILRYGDVDVFGPQCRAVTDLALGVGEARYLCTGLDEGVYTVGAAGGLVDSGIEPLAACVGGDSTTPPTVEVRRWEPAFCSLVVSAPTLRVRFTTETETTVLDRFLVLDERGEPADCAPHGDDALVCTDLAPGIFTVPDQPLLVGGPDETFSCSAGTSLRSGPGHDNTATLEPPVDLREGLLHVWTCFDTAPFEPVEPVIRAFVVGPADLLPELRIELRRDGFDIAGDGCRAGDPPPYLVPDGPHVYAECRGDWVGEIAPDLSGLPDGVTATARCFELQPVTGHEGPTFEYLGGDPDGWVCYLTVDA